VHAGQVQVETRLVAGRFRRLLFVAARLEALEVFVDVFRQHRHQPLSGAFDHHQGLRVLDPGRVALLRREPGEEHVSGDHDDQPAREAEQEAERAVERADLAVEHHVGDAHRNDRNDEQRHEEDAGDGDALGHGVAGEVALRQRRHARKGPQSDHGGDAPGGDRQHFPHETADHGQQAGDQHHHDEEDVQQSDRHRVFALRSRRGKVEPPPGFTSPGLYSRAR
jgi:hypothetical protein